MSGSIGLTSNSSDPINRISATAAARPQAIPIAARPEPQRTNMRVNSVRCAPSAMRMPISRVRCDTEYEITP